MTDFSKYGTPVAQPAAGQTNFSKYGTPVATQSASKGLSLAGSIWNQIANAASGGAQQFTQGVNEVLKGGSPLQGLESGLKAEAGLAGVAMSPLAPVFKPFSEGMNAYGDFVASHVPGIQDFAQSKAGDVTMRVAQDLSNAGTVASTILGVDQAAKGTQKAITSTKNLASNIWDSMTNYQSGLEQTPEKVIQARADEIANIQNGYAKLRKGMDYSKDATASSRNRIATTDVLVNAVDDNGLLRTKQPGGAVEQYKAHTIDGAEGVVRADLAREGKAIPLNTVRNQLRADIMDSGLEGAALTRALGNIDTEMEGLKLRADDNGRVPLEVLQDAKISTTNGIDYNTEANVKRTQKAIARGYKTLIEDHSNLPIGEVNAELAKYLQDVKLLESLDGSRVKGGRLGKYFGQISGNIIGGAAGNALGGPIGGALGTVAGGELAGVLQRLGFQSKFGEPMDLTAPANPVLQDAVSRSQSGPIALPAPHNDTPIQLPQSNSDGSLNTQYSPIPTTNKSPIQDTLPQDGTINLNEQNPSVDNSLISVAAKYKTPEEFVKAARTTPISEMGISYEQASKFFEGVPKTESGVTNALLDLWNKAHNK